jgi:Ca-activated chloride channel family protein
VRLLRPDLPVWLFALPVAAICWFIHYWYKWRQRRLAAFGGTALSRRTTLRRDVATLVLSVLTLALIAVAMMRPQVARERRTPTFERRDLIVILDRSASMRARDVLPSRFGRAVQEIQEFLRRKPATIDRVALVAFAGASVVLSYPTDDIGSLSFYLNWAHDDPTPFFGTDIGAALSTALSVARRDRQRLPPVFVVISDGEDQAGRLEPAAATVASNGIRVHCIGIGSDASVPMPVAVSDQREEFLRDDYGQIVTTRFDATTLQRLATLTGGQYFRSVTGGELLSALDSIALEERRQVGWTTATDYRDLYLLVLAAAALTSLGLVTLL